MESATENIPPPKSGKSCLSSQAIMEVRVKWWGKSPPPLS